MNRRGRRDTETNKNIRMIIFETIIDILNKEYIYV